MMSIGLDPPRPHQMIDFDTFLLRPESAMTSTAKREQLWQATHVSPLHDMCH